MAFICTSSFEPRVSVKSEMKLIVLALAKIVEWLVYSSLGNDTGVVQNCFTSLLEMFVHLEGVKGKEDESRCMDTEDETEDSDNESNDFENS